jgi:tetratricopeptide (TPR) repeat protein
MGDLEFSEGDWEQARGAYARVTGLNPEAGRAWLMLGTCSLKLGDYEAAREELSNAAAAQESAAEAGRMLRYLDSLIGGEAGEE